MPLYLIPSSEDLFYVNVLTALHPFHTAKLTGPGGAGGALPPLPPIGWGGGRGEKLPVTLNPSIQKSNGYVLWRPTPPSPPPIYKKMHTEKILKR